MLDNVKEEYVPGPGEPSGQWRPSRAVGMSHEPWAQEGLAGLGEWEPREHKLV